jgi:hypothetical protein
MTNSIALKTSLTCDLTYSGHNDLKFIDGNLFKITKYCAGLIVFLGIEIKGEGDS